MSQSAPVVALGEFPSHHGLIDRFRFERVSAPRAAAFHLVECGGELELRPPAAPDRPGLRSRFPPDAGRPGPGRKAPLAKAFGRRVGLVVDATAGLGADAYRLAAAGFAVQAWERQPALYALVQSGWQAASDAGRISDAVLARLSFSWGDSTEAIRAFDGLDAGAYFDPMYPPPRKTAALPKRPLQILRALLPVSEEAGRGAMLDAVEAARLRFARVVVKRPHHAEPLVAGADFEVATKLVRFDVYLNPARMEASGV